MLLEVTTKRADGVRGVRSRQKTSEFPDPINGECLFGTILGIRDATGKLDTGF